MFRAETEIDFEPQSFQEAAGLTLYYNRFKFHFLAVTYDERFLGRALTIMSCEGDVPQGRLTFPLAPVALEAGPVRLRASVDRAKLQFAYAVGETWRDVGPPLDASLISDEAGAGEHGSFTGAFIGHRCVRYVGRRKIRGFWLLRV